MLQIVNGSRKKRPANYRGWMSVLRRFRIFALAVPERSEVRGTTGSKQAEIAVQRGEQAYGSLFERNPDAVFSLNMKGIITSANKSCCQLFGGAIDEIVGSHFAAFFFRENLQILRVLSSVQKGVRSNLETAVITPSGKRLDLSVTTMPVVLDGVISGMYCIARDITEQKCVQRETQKLEMFLSNERQRFADMFRDAPVGMAILKGKDHIFDKANALYYILSRRVDLIGRSVREVFPEVAGQGIFELLDQVFETGETFSANEFHVRLDDGQGKAHDLYLNFIYQPYRDAEGKVEGIFFFGVDVSEQVAARKKIESSEKRYRQIVETTDDGIWLIDENDRTVFANKRMAEILGCSEDELATESIYALLKENYGVFAVAGLKESASGIKGAVEFRHITKNGEMVWIHLFASLIFDEDGKFNGSLGMFTDITARKLYEDELQKLSLIARKTVNPVIISDAERRIEWINEAFQTVMECTLAEVKGKKTDDVLFVQDADGQTLNYVQQRVAGAAPFECQLMLKNRAARMIWMDVQGQPVKDDSGNLTHYMYIFTDMTQRKRDYEKLVKTENEVRMFARQLNSVLEEERSRIAREIHDEFGQQLAGFKMSLSSLAKFGYRREGGSEQMIRDMMRGVESTIESLRVFSTELRPGILDTLGLIAAIEWLMKGFEKKTGIICSLEIRVWKRQFDKEVSIAYFRICQEALTNIIKHAHADRVKTELIQHDERLSLIITDNGTGMAVERLENAFSLGLLGMRERAKLIDGELSIVSHPGMGTRIYLNAPICPRV